MTHLEVGSPLGPLLLAADDRGLTHVHMQGVRGGPTPEGPPDPTHPVLAAAARQLGEYFAGRRRDFDLPLAAQGDLFHRRVWDLVSAIPFGATRTYGDLARELGGTGLAQAVGGAVGRNPIAVVVPCHRVVGADGSLTGYAGGLDRKRVLLALEEPDAGDAGRLF